MTVNMIPRSPLANCIALHDFAKDLADLKGWFEYTVAFFDKYGVTPTKAASTGVNGDKGRKNILFRNAKKRLEACQFQEIDSIWFAANPPNHRHDVFDVIFESYVSLRPYPPVMTLCLEDQVVSWKGPILKHLASDLSQFFGAQYGYCYQRRWSQGPGFYPSGVIGSSGRKETLSQEERARIGQWDLKYFANKNQYHTGDLRDIYPMNVICRAHLERKIGLQTLKAWIESDSIHGTLEPLEETVPSLWAWWVENEHIPVVRDALLPTGIILCV